MHRCVLRTMVILLVASTMLTAGSFADRHDPAPAAATTSAAGLPATISATYFDKGEGTYVFRDRATDLARMREAFNTIVVSASPWRDGDTSLVEAIRAAGMSAILEFDYKDEFLLADGPAYLSQKVDEIVATTRAHPGLISGIHVADQLNKGTLTPDQQIAYLQATGGRFHAEVPGVPVFVDAASWELTCDQAEQASCVSQRDGQWQYQTNAVLQQLAATGTVDGFFVSDNLQHNRADVQATAMGQARGLFPALRIVSRSSHLSFPEATFPGDATSARTLVDAYIRASLDGGADGAALWSWHRPWTNSDGVAELRTFLDKDFGDNALWAAMVASRPGGAPNVPSPSPILVRSTGFEAGLRGWTGRGATVLRRVTARHSGSHAALASNPTRRPIRCGFDDYPTWVRASRAGTYQLTAWVRGKQPGRRISLAVRELSGRSVLGSAQTVVRATGAWQRVQVRYRVRRPGSALDLKSVVVTGARGRCLLLDDVTLHRW